MGASQLWVLPGEGSVSYVLGRHGIFSEFLKCATATDVNERLNLRLSEMLWLSVFVHFHCCEL